MSNNPSFKLHFFYVSIIQNSSLEDKYIVKDYFDIITEMIGNKKRKTFKELINES